MYIFKLCSLVVFDLCVHPKMDAFNLLGNLSTREFLKNLVNNG